jgi:hypothetical protein
MVENQLKVIVIRIGNHVSNVPQHRAYLIFAYLNKTTMSDVNEMTQAELEFHELHYGGSCPQCAEDPCACGYSVVEEAPAVEEARPRNVKRKADSMEVKEVGLYFKETIVPKMTKSALEELEEATKELNMVVEKERAEIADLKAHVKIHWDVQRGIVEAATARIMDSDFSDEDVDC